jgi:biopolymer transport protein ExbD
MKLIKPKQRRNEEMLIPLINIIFLMLIFYMLAGKIVASDKVKVQPPVSISEVASETQGIMVLVAADGRLAIENDMVNMNGLATAITQHLEKAKTGERVTAAGEAATIPLNTSAPTIKLKVDARATAQLLNKTLATLRGAGANRITLVTAPSPR